MKSKVGYTILFSFLLCSCAIIDSRAEKSYLGQWRAVHEGKTIDVALEPNQRCVLSQDGKAWVGKWSIQKGEITITVTGIDRVRGFINSAGDLVLITPMSKEAVVFKKIE
jgi:hypothetical protein